MDTTVEAMEQGSSVVLPFPRALHAGFVSKHAVRLSHLTPPAAERYLSFQLAIQRETMVRRGIAVAAVEREVGRLEVAIRRASHLLITARREYAR